MARAYSAIRAAIQAAADTAGHFYKLILGSTGSYMLWPEEENNEGSVSEDTGQLWVEAMVPNILTHVGAEMDKTALCWATVQTNATGVAPTIVGSSGFSAITKTEPGGLITIGRLNLTFSSAYANANYAVMASLLSEPTGITFPVKDTGNVSISFYDVGLADAGINGQYIHVITCGQA